jgi:hypothetical protein
MKLFYNKSKVMGVVFRKTKGLTLFMTRAFSDMLFSVWGMKRLEDSPADG